MKLPPRFWINQLSFLGFIALIAFLPAHISGEFFAIFAKDNGQASSVAAFTLAGTIFGFSSLSLVLIGAIAIPGELLGLIRPYKPNDLHFAEAQIMARKVLLITASLLAWVALLSLGTFAFSLNAILGLQA